MAGIYMSLAGSMTVSAVTGTPSATTYTSGSDGLWGPVLSADVTFMEGLLFQVVPQSLSSRLTNQALSGWKGGEQVPLVSGGSNYSMPVTGFFTPAAGVNLPIVVTSGSSGYVTVVGLPATNPHFAGALYTSGAAPSALWISSG